MRAAAVFFLLACVACGCGAPTVTPAPTFQADSTPEIFEGPGIAFEHPVEWHESTYESVPVTRAALYVLLSTSPIADPCQPFGMNGRSCSIYPRDTAIGENGVVISWTHRGSPSGFEPDPTVGESIAVDGRAATLDRRPAANACTETGGTQEIVVQIPTPNVSYNWDEMDACIRGPDVDTIEAKIRAMLASVRWIEPPDDPRPTHLV